MSMIQLSVYEALTEAGVKPDAARKVERQIESALQMSQDSIRTEMHEQQAKAELASKTSEDAVRTEMRHQLMSKADGSKLEAALRSDITDMEVRLVKAMNEQTKAMNEQTWKLVGFVLVANGLMLAVLRLLPT